MKKIVKSLCNQCRSTSFQFIGRDQNGNIIQCLVCNTQQRTKKLRSVYNEHSFIETLMMEKGIHQLTKRRNQESMIKPASTEQQTPFTVLKEDIHHTEKDPALNGLFNSLEQDLVRMEKGMHQIGESIKRRYQQRKIKLVEGEQPIESKTINNEEKNIAVKKLFQLFEQDFLNSKKTWLDELSKCITEKEFHTLAASFVKDWFGKQGWQSPDEEQAHCIAEVWKHVQVIARAGSGKTATTVNRAAFLIKHCNIAPSKILLLAFNREAAEEVQKRLTTLLGQEAPQAMTFHALAYAIVHPEEALIHDEELNGFQKSSTVQQVIDSFLRHPVMSEKVKEFMLKYFRTEWEEIASKGHQMKPDEMVEYRRSLPYVGLDGRNYKSTGEKRIADYLFERKIPYSYEKNFWWEGLNYKPDFTISLNNQKRKGIVIEYYGMTGDKEYDKQTKQKKEFWKKKSDYYYIELFPNQAASMETLDHFLKVSLQNHQVNTQKMNDFEIWHQLKSRAVDEFSIMISGFIGRCRKSLITPGDLVGKVKSQRESLSDLEIEFLRIVWRIYQEYLETLVMNDEEDFDGLLMRAAEKIDSGESKWERKAGSGDLQSLQYLFIDEYQDFSLLFSKVIKAVVKINSDLTAFCVGDDWQAINGFAGSDLQFFTNFQTYFPEARKLYISSNYRSDQNIVTVGNQLMYKQGQASVPVSSQLGKVRIANLNEFMPNDFEKTKYNGDVITPMLIRLVYSFVKKGQRIALLCRKGGSLPWYTPYDARRGKFHAEFLEAIKKALPEEMRPLVVAMNTAHSYKGKEEDAIIIVDAVNRSFPLIHPSNVFFGILGHNIETAIAEEKRLFYVALSRAKHSLVILTEKGLESPFLAQDLQMNLSIETMNVTKIEAPKGTGTHYMIKLANQSYNKHSGTFVVKDLLKAHQYRWSAADKSWIKSVMAEGFTKEKLLNESWAKEATNIKISVVDEFENEVVTVNLK